MRNNLLSFFILGAGVGSQFISIIAARNILNEEDFYFFAYFLLYVNICSMFVSLGSEQMIIRLSKFDGSKLFIGRSVVIILLLASLLYFFVFGFVVLSDIWLGQLATVFVFSTIGIFFGNFIGQLFRARSDFVLSQLSLNVWRMLLFPIVIVVKYLNVNLSVVLNIAFLSCILFYIIQLESIKITVFHDSNQKDMAISLFFGYFLSVMTLTIMVNFDRLLVEKNVDSADFSYYLYLVNLYVTPFVVLSNYFGFKDVIKFKEGVNVVHYYSMVLKVVFSSVVVFFIYSFVLSFLNSFVELPSIQIWFCFLAIVIMRSLYSVNSAAFGVIVSAGAIFRINLIFLFLLGFVFLLVEGFSLGVFEIMCISVFLWGMRNFIYLYNLVVGLND